MVTQVQLVQASQPTGRITRKPKHSFQLRQRPFHIQPSFIAPVLPGETMENMLIQQRTITDPIKNPLIGWWCEHYVFYIKHRDLDPRDTITAAHLDGTLKMPSNAGAKVALYKNAVTSARWVEYCLKRVTDTYFRDEPDIGSLGAPFWDGDIPLAYVQSDTWLDSVKDGTVAPPGHPVTDLPGEGDVPTDIIPGFETQYAQWQHMRALKVTDATFEDYLKSFGVKVAVPEPEELHRPELIRYVRDWAYPTNTVEATTGVPASAVSWNISERADKARFFSEPGFLFGVCVVRPKVYFSGQKGAAVTMMDDAFAWLPAVLSQETYTSLKLQAAAAGPLAGVTNDYWVDLRDLFIYGDQFVNFAVTATDAGFVALPTAGMQKKVPSSADVDALFKAAAPANLIRTDGRVDFTILSRLRDVT